MFHILAAKVAAAAAAAEAEVGSVQ